MIDKIIQVRHLTALITNNVFETFLIRNSDFSICEAGDEGSFWFFLRGVLSDFYCLYTAEKLIK